MDNVLIDTDVVLDFFFDRQPFSEHAVKVFSLCELKEINGFVTPVILSNVYYLLRRNARQDKVIERLSQLLLIVDVLQMDGDTVRNALNSGFNDFEDALQNFAAITHAGINVILTRNIKDYKKSEIGVMTPETYIKSQIARQLYPPCP